MTEMKGIKVVNDVWIKCAKPGCHNAITWYSGTPRPIYCVEHLHAKIITIDIKGPPGSGKSFLIRTILPMLQALGFDVVVSDDGPLRETHKAIGETRAVLEITIRN